MPLMDMGPEVSGSRLVEQDSINNFMKMAQGQELQARAEQERLKTQQAQQLMQSLSQLKTPDGMGGPGAGGSLADIPAWQGKRLMEMGQPAMGGQLLEQAAKIRLQEAQSAEVGVRQAKEQVETQGKNWTMIGQLAGSIKTEADWQAAGVVAARAGLPNPFQGPFQPERLPQIQSMAISRKDALQIDLNRSAVAAENAVRGARVQFMRDRIGQHDQEIKNNKEYRDALIKIAGSKDARGGKPVTSPSEPERKAAYRLVAEEFPNISAETLSEIGDAVASEAEALVQTTRGLDIDKARRRALQVWKEDGTIQAEQGLMQTVTGGLTGEPNVSFQPGGRTPEEPIQAKPGMKYIPGRYYRGPQGIGRRTPDGRWEMVGG